MRSLCSARKPLKKYQPNILTTAAEVEVAQLQDHLTRVSWQMFLFSLFINRWQVQFVVESDRTKLALLHRCESRGNRNFNIPLQCNLTYRGEEAHLNKAKCAQTCSTVAVIVQTSDIGEFKKQTGDLNENFY